MKKLNPLHTPDMLDRVVRETGRYFDADRGTGRSTVLALKAIAKAMEYPHTWVRLIDHPTKNASNELTCLVDTLVQKLGFKHFTVSPSGWVCFGTPSDRPPVYGPDFPPMFNSTRWAKL